MPSPLSRIKGLMVQGLGAAFANRPAARALASVKGGYQILTYHRVLPAWDPLAIAPVSAADFSAQMKLLRDCYHVVPLEALLADLDARRLRPGTVCVTLDDGYRDNCELALPILKAYGIPATIFLATDFIGGNGALWYDKVLQAFRQTRRDDFSLPQAGLVRQTLRGLKGRFHPSHLVLEWLKGAPPAEREARMQSVYAALDLPGEPRCDLMLDWDQVRAMRGQSVSFGAHTRSHPILSTLGPEANEAEIAGSKAAMEKELGIPVSLFAYPNGKRGDYGEAAKAALRKFGFACALTTNPGVNAPDQDRFEIKRSQPWEDSVHRFHGRMVMDRLASTASG